MSHPAIPIGAVGDLLVRSTRALGAAWDMRHAHTPLERTPLERQFLPAALEIIDTPAPALPRAIILTISAAFVLAILWATFGHIDMVAIAPGRIIAADKAKVIQPAETAVVKRILVRDGQAVAAGEVLVELEAATATAAETARLRESLAAARLEAARFDALARAASGQGANPTLPAAAGTAPLTTHLAEQRALTSQYQEHRARLATLDAEIAKRRAELAAAKELAAKLAQTAPIAKRRAEDSG